MSDNPTDRKAWLSAQLQRNPAWKLNKRQADARAERALKRGDRNRENGNR